MPSHQEEFINLFQWVTKKGGAGVKKIPFFISGFFHFVERNVSSGFAGLRLISIRHGISRGLLPF